jgi:hypothetical protein
VGTNNEDLLRASLTEEFYFDIGKTLTLEPAAGRQTTPTGTSTGHARQPFSS